MNKVFLIAAACMLLVGCSGKQFFYLPIGTSTGGSCPDDAYCTDVREVSTYSVTYNLTTVTDSRGPDPNAFYQVLT